MKLSNGSPSPQNYVFASIRRLGWSSWSRNCNFWSIRYDHVATRFRGGDFRRLRCLSAWNEASVSSVIDESELDDRSAAELRLWRNFIAKEDMHFKAKSHSLTSTAYRLMAEQEHWEKKVEEVIPEEEEESDSCQELPEPEIGHDYVEFKFPNGRSTRRRLIRPTLSSTVMGVNFSENKCYATVLVQAKPADEHTSVFVYSLAKKSDTQPIHRFDCHTCCWFGNDIYFTEINYLQRPFRVSCLRVADSLDFLTSPADVIYSEGDASFSVDVSVSKDKEVLFVSSVSKSASEVRFKFAKEANLSLIAPRRENVQYFVEHSSDQFWIVTNFDDDSGNYQLWSTPDRRYEQKNWKRLYREDGCEDTVVEEMDVFSDRVVSFVRSKTTGGQQVKVYDLQGKLKETVLESSWFQAVPNPDFFQRHTFIAGGMPICDRKRVLGGNSASCVEKVYDVLGIKQELVLAGPEQIPITLAYDKNMLRSDGNNRMLVEAYGAYGIPLVPFLDTAKTSLIKRGWIVAHAHIRGGSEKGRTWHRGGSLLNKRNSVEDLVTCVKFLHKEGLGMPSLTAGQCSSAGAIPFAVIANENPELFKAMILRAPFLAVLDLMCDPTLPLTVQEYEEWGNPSDSGVLEYMQSYDPMLNLSPADSSPFPNIWITYALADKRVPFWTICEYVNRLRDYVSVKKGNQPDVVLRLCSSHFDGDSMTEKTMQYSWLEKIFQQF